MKALIKTLVNLVYPDPTRNAEVKAVLDEIKYPWKRSDWIAIGILALTLAALIAFWPA